VAGMMACDVCDLHVSTQTCGVRELGHDMSAVYGASLQFALNHTATVWRKGALANTILRGTVQDTQCNRLERNLNAQMLANDFAY